MTFCGRRCNLFTLVARGFRGGDGLSRKYACCLRLDEIERFMTRNLIHCPMHPTERYLYCSRSNCILVFQVIRIVFSIIEIENVSDK
jgi:hypothetical protein